MTDEELKRLCEDLRSIEAEHADELIDRLHESALKAADEIERLVKELAEAKHHDMRDWYDALERGRKDPIR